MGMYVSNNKVLQKLPNLISTIGDLPEETKTVITPYGNKYKVFNLGYQYSNPLILPLDITLDAIVYGNITLSSTIVKSDSFQIVTESGSKFAITGEGTVLLWYRYGKIDPGTFDTVMNYALEQNDYVLVDALLHTLSIQEAISFVLQNPSAQEMFLKGLDWQLNKIGFKDFLAYLNGGRYDVRHLALFLTIASYVFPCVFSYSGIPQYSGKPLQVFVMYLMYLSEFGQVVTTQLAYLSEQIDYQQSEIEQMSEMVENQSAEIAVLFAQDYLMQSEINELSEEVENEQSEITALSEYVSECCNSVLIQLGKVITDLVKLTGVVGYVVNSLTSEGIISGSEGNVLDTALSEIGNDLGSALNALSGLAQMVIPNINVVNALLQDVSEVLPIINVLANLGGIQVSESTVGNNSSSSGGLLGGLLGSLL